MHKNRIQPFMDMPIYPSRMTKVTLLTLVFSIGLSVGCRSTTPPVGTAEQSTPETWAFIDGPAPGEGRFILASFSDDVMGTDDYDDDFDSIFGDELEAVDVNDPLEGLNRAIFAMNDLLYQGFLTPISRVYGGVTPEPVRRGVGNFFDNLRFPIRFTNQALQGKFRNSWLETRKFLLNTTVGVLGFGTPADKDEELRDIPGEDFGQTLATWGIRNPPYLVLPLLGPSTARDAVGTFGDSFLYPPIYILDREEYLMQQGANLLNRSPWLMEEYNSFRRSAIDPYAAMRNAYLEYREREIER